MLVRRVGPLTVLVHLGKDARSFPAIPALLKLCSLEPDALALETKPDEPATRVSFRRGDRSFEVPRALLGRLDAVVLAALKEIVPPYLLVAGAHRASTELARATALHEIVRAMLSAESLDKALATFVAGVTAGAGLSFHRAAIFVKDPAHGGFIGALGVGPANAEEAHRIWESLASEPVPFEKELARAGSISPFSTLVKRTRLSPGTSDADEVRLALGGSPAIFSRPEGPVAKGLASLDPAKEFVLVRVAARDHVLGLLYADRRFEGAEIDTDAMLSLEAFVRHAALVWETLRLSRENEELARVDAVTSLHNRREFEARFAHERSRAHRTKSSLSLLLIDLDQFREVNNKKGHEAGDAVLRATGALLRSELRAHDIAARFGGDELVVVLPAAGSLEAALVARRIGVAAHRRGISFSMGVASFPDDCEHPDDLVSVADTNLYAAKDAGRGRACLAGEGAPIVFSEEDESADRT